MSFFATPTEVRQESGFGDNTNITDAQIASIIDLVENEIESKISKVYSLPMPVFYKNTITFTGTGTASATMTISIDGQDYEVAVTNGMTATEAADLFRTAVIANDNKDMLLNDQLGHGAVVTIVADNQSEAPADVTITSTDPQTVSGITATGGTVTGFPVALIQSITRGMASARLLMQEYGEESQDTTKDGSAKMKLFQEFLDDIANKKLSLIDYAGTELAHALGGRIAFYPTEASRTDVDEPTANKFTMNTQF